MILITQIGVGVFLGVLALYVVSWAAERGYFATGFSMMKTHLRTIKARLLDYSLKLFDAILNRIIKAP